VPLAQIAFLKYVILFILLSWSVYIVYRAGQLNYTPVLTMAIGAYFSAYAVRDLHWHFVLALIVAIGLGALVALVAARGLARAPAFTVIIASIGFIFIGQTVFRNLDFLGGTHGYLYIPNFGYVLPLACVALVVVGFFIYRLDYSRLGRAMETIFVDPDLAATLGVDIYKVRVFLHAAAGALGALAGVFYAFFMLMVHYSSFSFSLLLQILCFLFVGGYTTMWGLVAFTPILWAISVFLPASIGVWKDIIFGTLLITILILRPDGVVDKNVIRAISSKGRAWLGRLRRLRKIEEVAS
jgi:branched-chain amino acid transport system permease protein